MAGPRVVMFVMNTVEYDRRVLREATALAKRGCSVTVIGVQADGRTPDAEERPEGFEIRRVPVSWQPMSVAARANTDAIEPSPRAAANQGTLHWLVRSRIRWWRWRLGALRLAPRADVYHGHDLPGLGVAAAARSANRGRLVYDSHDLFVESGANASRPRWAKSTLELMERRWYREADHLITVNHGIAERLHARYGPMPTSIVHNCVPRWTPTAEDRTLLRRAAGVDRAHPVVLYHGGFSANRGLGVLIKAMAHPTLSDTHLVLLGYGPMEAELHRLAETEAVRGRVHVLPPVAPELLDRYVAGADVVAMLNQPVSQNEILSTPNKLFEAIGAGVPVVTSDFPLRRQIVMEEPTGPLGAVCDPTDPVAISHAIGSLMALPPGERSAQRNRCLAAAHRRWNWEREERVLCDAYDAVLAREPVINRSLFRPRGVRYERPDTRETR